MTPTALLPLLLLALPLAAQAPDAPRAAGPDPVAALHALAPQPPVERGVRVLVRGAVGAPAADAIVVFVANDDPQYVASAAEATRRFGGDEVGYQAFRTGNGTRYAVDERGATRVPAVAGRVFACRGADVAFRSIPVEAGKALPRVELDLAPPLSFAVAVADANGQPAANVTVGIAVTPRSGVFPRTATGADGVAAFRLLPARSAEARVRLLAATKERIEAPLPAPAARIALRLPRCTTVHAAYDGALLPGAAVTWALARDDRRFAPATSDTRSAVFRHVEVGFSGRVEVSCDGILVAAPLPEVTADGECRVALARDPARRSLAVRVLDADGAPARSCWLDASWRFQHGSSGTNVRTNGEGWLELEPPEHVLGDVELRLTLRGRTWNDAPAGTLSLPLTAADTGRVDRGEQRCARIPPTLRGVAVDTNGKALAGVLLETQHDGWHRTQTNADGTFVFTIPGDRPPSLELSLLLGAWYFTDPTSRTRSFTTGADARLVLQPAGRLRFAAPGLPDDVAHSFDVRLEPADGDRRDAIRLDLQLRGSELLLPAGHWSFVVIEDEREVHRIDGVRVDAGIEVHDPRFMAFDWRAFAALTTVRVQDRAGVPTDACTVWYQYGSRGRGHQLTGGVGHFLVPTAAGGTLRVEPRDKSIATVHLGTVTGEHVVRLGSGPRLAVTLSALPRLPAGATLLLHGGLDHDGVPFDEHGKATLWLAEPGELRVMLSVRIGHTRHVLSEHAVTCDVPAAGRTLTIPVTEQVQQSIDRRVASERR
jgi:hypothetical protein